MATTVKKALKYMAVLDRPDGGMYVLEHETRGALVKELEQYSHDPDAKVRVFKAQELTLRKTLEII